MTPDEYLSQQGFDAETNLARRYRILSGLLKATGDETLVKKKMSPDDFKFARGETTSSIEDRTAIESMFGIAGTPREVSVSDIDALDEGRGESDPFSAGIMNGIDASGLMSLGRYAGRAATPDEMQVPQAAKNEIADAKRREMVNSGDGEYAAGHMIGGLAGDLPLFAVPSAPGAAIALGAGGAAREANQQDVNGEERDWGKIAAAGVGEGVGAALGMKAGDFVKGAVRIPVVAPLAENMANATVYSGVTNGVQGGYNAVADNEDPDRLEQFGEGVLGGFFGFGLHGLLKGAGKVKELSSLPGAAAKEAKSIAAIKNDEIKNHEMVMSDPRVQEIMTKKPEDFTPEDISVLNTAVRRTNLKDAEVPVRGEIKAAPGLEWTAPKSLPVVNGKFTPEAFAAGKAYESLKAAEQSLKLKDINAAKKQYAETIKAAGGETKQVKKIKAAIDGGESLLDARYENGSILRDTKITTTTAPASPDAVTLWNITKAQGMLSEAVNAQQKKAYSVKEFLKPSTWKAAYKGQRVPVLEKAKIVGEHLMLDRAETVNRMFRDITKASGAKSFKDAPAHVQVSKARFDAIAGNSALSQHYINKAEADFKAEVAPITKEFGSDYAAKCIDLSQKVAYATRVYNLAKMYGEKGRLPKNTSLSSLESMLSSMDDILRREGVQPEHVYAFMRGMEKNASLVRDILSESGALSPEVRKLWEESGLYVPLAHIVDASDINKALIDAIETESRRFGTADNLFHVKRSTDLIDMDYGQNIARAITMAVEVGNRYRFLTSFANTILRHEAAANVGRENIKAVQEAAQMRDLYAIHKADFDSGASAKSIIEKNYRNNRSDAKLINQIHSQLKVGGEEGLEKYISGLEMKGRNVEALKDMAASTVKTEKADQLIRVYRPDGHGEDMKLYVSRRFLDDIMQVDSNVLDQAATFMSHLFFVRPLRASATILNPSFAVVNTARDTFHIVMTDSNGVLTDSRKVLPLAKSLFHLIVYDGRMGADDKAIGNSILQILFKKAFKPEEYKALNDSFNARRGSRMGSVSQFSTVTQHRSKLNKAFDGIVSAIEFSERVTKMAYDAKARSVLPKRWREFVEQGKWTERDFEEAMEHVGELSAWTAAKAIDFSQGGTVSRLMSGVFPYMNAGIQSSRTFLRSAHEDPALFAARLSEFVVGCTAISVYNAMCGGYDQALPQDRVSGINIAIPILNRTTSDGEPRMAFLWAPIPQELMPIKGFIDAVVVGHNGGFDTKTAVQGIMAGIPAIPSTPPIMSAAQALINNYDTFHNDKVWKGPDVAPGRQYTSDTHYFYRMLGEAFPELISPVRLERAVSAIIPQSNSFMAFGMGALDQAGEAIGYMPDDDRNRMVSALGKSLGVGRFLRETRPMYWAYDQKRDMALEQDREIGEAQMVGKKWGKVFGDAIGTENYAKAQSAQQEMMKELQARGMHMSPKKVVAAVRSFRGAKSNRVDQQRKLLQPYYKSTQEDEE